jgi:hypothetical protein
MLRHCGIAIGGSALLLAAGGTAHSANSAADVCQRWVCDRADISEGMSTGNVSTCDQGDLLPPGRPNSLKLVNLYRYLAGTTQVTEDPNFDTMAQACAIIQAANPITHTPTTSSACYNATGASASNMSSICSGQSVGCIDLYMNDANGGGPGFGHRQWMFANSLGPVGFGSVGTGRSGTGSCFYQTGGKGKANIPYVAWPPGGPIPLAAITTTNVDKAGWSIQSDTISMPTTVTATVVDGTTNMPVTVTGGLPQYGAKYVMSILPMGWTEQAGHSYTVTVSGAGMPITYTIEVDACTGVTTANCSATSGAAGTGGGAAGTTGSSGGAGTTGATGAAGTTGAAGRGGGAGTRGTAGTSGAAGSGAAGTTGGGVAGVSGGSAGTGGPAVAGTSGGAAGVSGGTAGVSGAAGTGVTAGAAGSTGEHGAASGGCACGIAGGSFGEGAWALLIVAALLGRRRPSARAHLMK